MDTAAKTVLLWAMLGMGVLIFWITWRGGCHKA